VIPTQVNLAPVSFLVKGQIKPGQMPGLKPFSIFHNTVTGFLSDLSEALRKDKEAGLYSDVVTFAFFCRKANLNALEKPYRSVKRYCLGRGVSFHIAPSNIPVNFAYSLAASLLCGNACIVRVSRKPFPQVNIICKAIEHVLGKDVYAQFKNYIAIVRYEHKFDLNAYFSGLCDVRIIWGGDHTISEIRKAPLCARAFDVTFADRYSIGVIHAEHYLSLDDKQEIASGFYNDTCFFDQNACTSPRLLVWVGSRQIVEMAKIEFWKRFNQIVENKGYINEPITVVDKFTVLCKAAIALPRIKMEESPNNTIMRVKVDTLNAALPEFVCAGGVFYEYSDTCLEPLMKIISRKYQTLAYIGFEPEELRNAVVENGVPGIDRIVPFGKTSDFSLIWDGYDLVRQLSRMVASQ